MVCLSSPEPCFFNSGEWTTRIVHLLNDHHMGVVTAAASLIDALVKKNPEEYKGCISLAVSRLSRVIEYISFPALVANAATILAYFRSYIVY